MSVEGNEPPKEAPPNAAREENLSLGERLRRARSSKGIELATAAQETRINLSSLKALEDNNQEALPAPAFARGFVRIYAAYLGLDPDQALRQHIKEQGLPTAATTEKININEIMAAESMAEAPRTLTGNRMVILLLLLVTVFLAYWGYTSYFRPATTPDNLVREGFLDPTRSEPTAPPPYAADQPATAATITPLPEPAAPGSDPATAPQGAPRGELEPAVPPAPEARTEAHTDTLPEAASASTYEDAPAEVTETAKPENATTAAEPQTPAAAPAEAVTHTLRARFTEETWLRARVDNNPPREFYFQRGESHTWRANQRVELRIGNAGGVELYHNDQPLPPLGASGEIANISIP